MMLMGKLKLAAAVAIVLGLSAIGIGALAGGPRHGAGTGTAQVVRPRRDRRRRPRRTRARPPRRRRSRAAPVRRFASRGDHDLGPRDRSVGPAGRRGHGLRHRRQSPAVERRRRDVLATATTGPDGRFVARDVELPVWKPEPSPVPAAEEGRFQVAATAPGFGFTWHPIACFRPADRPPSADRKPGRPPTSRKPSIAASRSPSTWPSARRPPCTARWSTTAAGRWRRQGPGRRRDDGRRPAARHGRAAASTPPKRSPPSAWPSTASTRCPRRCSPPAPAPTAPTGSTACPARRSSSPGSTPAPNTTRSMADDRHDRRGDPERPQPRPRCRAGSHVRGPA